MAVSAFPDTTPPFQDLTLPFDVRAADLVSRLTLQEKVSQMVHPAAAVARLGIPAYNWWNECLHGVARAGVATVFPQAIGLAATFDTELMGQIALCQTEYRRSSNGPDRDRDLRRGARQTP